MLRTSEITSLCKRQITFNSDISNAVIALSSSKTSGPNIEEVVLYDAVAVKALHRAVAAIHLEDRVYRKAANKFGEDLRWLCAKIGFEHPRLMPYSLRRGGATWHMHEHGSLAQTALLGRWKHENTAKIYIHGAAAELATWSLDSKASKILKQGETAFVRAFG